MVASKASSSRLFVFDAEATVGSHGVVPLVAPKASCANHSLDADLLATVGSQPQTHTVVPGTDIVGVPKNHTHTPTHRSKKRRLLPDWMKKKPDEENPDEENPGAEDPDEENPGAEDPDAEKRPHQETSTPRVNKLSSLDFSLLFTNFSNSRLVTKARPRKKKQLPPARGQMKITSFVQFGTKTKTKTPGCTEDLKQKINTHTKEGNSQEITHTAGKYKSEATKQYPHSTTHASTQHNTSSEEGDKYPETSQQS